VRALEGWGLGRGVTSLREKGLRRELCPFARKFLDFCVGKNDVF